MKISQVKRCKIKNLIFEYSNGGVMVIVVGNGHMTQVQILDKTDCISHCTNILGKGMNSIILPPAMGK